ncbi:uncharacterized protein LAESUDRAFT_713663 [Laetiporus sulphureus 93-53]|uniref:Uncharacterized protein n=1 Tax=Laetiporus sulphureus 93-53 TaxID=1314785 RepID=A0A165EJ30_9APHY|nr:uncharacterized protein LAESUDRAFT_713663 [Laetiporus sulphureus 93-53]KZT07155.1 hypothetical protein LAESUDRAFT_713663 [Laetiporus sulphureus 93-53]
MSKLKRFGDALTRASIWRVTIEGFEATLKPHQIAKISQSSNDCLLQKIFAAKATMALSQVASTGCTRRADIDINDIEHLIFTQAVYEYGSDKWGDISGLLSKHLMISCPKNPLRCGLFNSV